MILLSLLVQVVLIQLLLQLLLIKQLEISLHCVYVDTGFMRKDETEEIEKMLAEQGIQNSSQ